MTVIIEKESGTGRYILSCEIWLPAPLQTVFQFFADPLGLEDLTPPNMSFKVLTPKPITMAADLKIDFRVKVHGIPLRWQSQISVFEPPYRFVDVQLGGPYRHWEHEHTLREHNGGTIVGDRVTYAVPGGALMHWLFVRRDLERIFSYRQEKLLQLFPGNAESVEKVPD